MGILVHPIINLKFRDKFDQVMPLSQSTHLAEETDSQKTKNSLDKAPNLCNY